MSTAPTRKAGRYMIILAWIFAFFLLALFFHFTTQSDTGSFEYSAQHGTLTIDGDAKGHYWVDGAINNVSVRFMVDTGASLVAIPENLVKKMGLSGRYPVRLQTAAGTVEGQLARVKTLRFSGFRFSNVKAVIMPADGSETVLLGMNILSDFTIMQKDGKLVIKR